MNTPYTIVNVTPDTPEWEEERRHSIGASEVAAVLGLSSYSTPLTVYKSKHGIDQDFDPILAWIGHQSEAIVHNWIEQHSGLGVTLTPGFMARSIEFPWLHATFDRVTSAGDKVQIKTAHQYTGHKWDEGVPTEIRVQVQAEMVVSGDPRALVVVWIGGREFRMFWELRDEKFIREHLIPGTQTFWEACQAGIAPTPQTVEEAAELWPGATGDFLELSETAFEALERRTVLLADIKAMQEEADALKLVAAEYVKDATELTYQGRLAYTFRPQKGRASLDTKQLAADHPELVAAYTRQGAGFRVLRHIKEKNA